MLIVFDLDGTLLDTLDDLRNAVNHALRTIGEPERNHREVRAALGNGIRALVQQSLGLDVDDATAERAFAAFRAYYMEHCLDLTRPFEGIMPLLAELRQRGVDMAIVSNKFDPAVKELNQRFFADYIDVAVGESATVRRKPCPDCLLTVMEHFGARPDDTLYVGDSEVDIETAQNAGVRCATVLWGFRDEDFLLAHGADLLIHTPADLLQFT